MNWTERTTADRQQAVREAMNDGLTYAKAAERLGTTRVAIAGIVKRSNGTIKSNNPQGWILPNRPAKLQRTKKQRLGVNNIREKRHQGLERLTPLSPPEDPKPFLSSKAWQPLKGSSPTPIEAHTNGQCRWPVGNPILFCAEPSGEAIYCPAHAALAHPERSPR